jgi:hypothetical protein
MHHQSTSGWEKSYFGGYLSILMKHPTLTGWSVTVSQVDKDKRSFLYFYEREKLAKILLYRIHSKEKDKANLLANSQFRRVFESLEQDSNYFYLRGTSLNLMYNLYMNYPDDVSPLFKEMKDEVMNLSIKILKKTPNDNSIESFAESISTINPINRYESLTSNREFSTTFRVVPQKTDGGSLKDQYTDEENLAANQLIQSLDVKFATGVHREDNLITGKLSEHKLAECMSGNTKIYYREHEKVNTKPFSVCILLDQSGSMDGYQYEMSYALLKVLYKTFNEILPENKLYIYGHSGQYDPIVNIYHEPGLASFEDTYWHYDEADLCENYDGPVIEELHKRLRNFTSDPILFIVLSDGCPCGHDYGGVSDYRDFVKIVERAKRDQFIAASIGLDYETKDMYKYNINVKNLDRLVPQVNQLLNIVIKTEFQE